MSYHGWGLLWGVLGAPGVLFELRQSLFGDLLRGVGGFLIRVVFFCFAVGGKMGWEG